MLKCTLLGQPLDKGLGKDPDAAQETHFDCSRAGCSGAFLQTQNLEEEAGGAGIQGDLWLYSKSLKLSSVMRSCL